MLDIRYGYLTVAGKNIIIKPGLTRQEFQSSDLFNDVLSEQVHNFLNYLIKPQEVYGKKFTMALFFDDQNIINLINMSLSDDGIVSSWENWSEQRELRRKEIHEKWLELNIGKPPYQYTWGEITSSYDSRSGSSLITFRYYIKK